MFDWIDVNSEAAGPQFIGGAASQRPPSASWMAAFRIEGDEHQSQSEPHEPVYVIAHLKSILVYECDQIGDKCRLFKKSARRQANRRKLNSEGFSFS
jgi:hypothetical protein